LVRPPVNAGQGTALFVGGITAILQLRFRIAARDGYDPMDEATVAAYPD
jgi:hypothetical protein